MGLVTQLCSCGTLPVPYKLSETNNNSRSLGMVVSFVTATQCTRLVSMCIMIGLLGWNAAWMRLVEAFLLLPFPLLGGIFKTIMALWHTKYLREEMISPINSFQNLRTKSPSLVQCWCAVGNLGLVIVIVCVHQVTKVFEIWIKLLSKCICIWIK